MNKTHLKRRVIDLDIIKVLTKPLNKSLMSKKYVCYFRAIVSFPQAKTNKNNLGAQMILNVITPPYTLPLWLNIWKRYKKQKDVYLNFIKVWGYPYKPNRDKVGFFILEATERTASIKNMDPNATPLQQAFTYIVNSHFIGEEYLKEKYPELKSTNRTNDFNFLTSYYTTKKNGKEAVLYYPINLEQTYNFIYEGNLSAFTNPKNKEELKDKPLYYQLVDRLTDEILKDHPEENPLELHKKILANNTYR